ncbi:MAG: PAS domain-containing protein [Hyphomicrobiaceae bacterium]|nr:PAS domain-containing protein [Hyphomicrobiaceae bacterium]
MRGAENKLLSLVSRLQAAGAGAIPWSAVLKEVADCVGGAGSALFSLNRRTGAFEDFVVYGLEPGAGQYVERMNRINPRMRYSLLQPGPHVVCDRAILPEAAIRRHEFYDWMERTNGTRYFVGARLVDVGDISVFASIEFTAHQGHPDEDQIAAFRRLLPNIEGAWRLWRLLQRAGAQSAAAALVQQVSPWGIVEVDGRGHVTQANRKAERMLAAGDGLRIIRQKLSAEQAADDRALQALIAETLSMRGEPVAGRRSLLAITRRGRKLPLAVRIAALPRGQYLHLQDAPAALIFISSFDGGLPEEDLQQVFGLSHREAELAALLADGIGLPAAVRRMGIAHNTGRAHLRDIFAKTGTRSQPQLVLLLSRIPTEG